MLEEPEHYATAIERFLSDLSSTNITTRVTAQWVTGNDVANHPSWVPCAEWRCHRRCRTDCAMSHRPSSTEPIPHFDVPLPIPPVLDPIRTDAATTDYYEIVQREERVEILPGQ